MLDHTHHPQLRSWVDSANQPNTDFPIQNLPLGVFARLPAGPASIGAAIGDKIVDLGACARSVLLDPLGPAAAAACSASNLNALMLLGRGPAQALRRLLSSMLEADSLFRPQIEPLLVDRAAVTMLLPVTVGDYTDFYTSLFHATNVGKLFRPDAPLLPNYKYVPIGYHGRASSIVVSGTPVRRPNGQVKPAEAATPRFGPTRSLDYELEVGCYSAARNELGVPIRMGDAEEHLFGISLLNDWSARDIQSWEYQPLGPFLAKNFATTVSPWVITFDALEPFRAPAFARAEGDPEPLPYLSSETNRAGGGLDIQLEVFLRTNAMRSEGREAVRVSASNLKDMYWTFAQLLTHHTSNGCNLQPGDLLASGTVSGDRPDARGCLLELTTRGSQPISLPSGETRSFLEDGDEVTLRGYCDRPGFVRIGFGECCGRIEPAISYDHT